MKVFVVGAHGQIGQLLIPKLVAEGDTVFAGIRNDEQAAEMKQLGATPVFFDLMKDPEHLADAFHGMGAIVFTAGSGGKTGDDMTMLIDLDGAVKTMEAAKLATVKRYIMVSSMRSENRETWGTQIRPYMAAKYYADQYLVNSDLDYTILRPGILRNDSAVGKIAVNKGTNFSNGIPREDVATTIATVLNLPATIHKTYDITEGDKVINDAFS